jgi:hypothetical protein
LGKGSVTGSREYMAGESFEKVASWYEVELGDRKDLVGQDIREDLAVWVYEPSHYDNGIMVSVTRNSDGTTITNMTYLK